MSCAGWICGIDVALRSLEENSYILVLASSTVGSRLHFYNKRDRAIFGDGAAGVLIGKNTSKKKKVMCTQLWTDGKFHTEITAPFSWSKRPANIPDAYEGSFYMSPDQDIFLESLSRVLPSFFNQLMDKAKMNVKDVDHFLLHQPSMPLFYHSLKALPDIPRSKVLDYFAKYGNLVAAEMPTFLRKGADEGIIRTGDIVFMLTYGAGFTMAGYIFEY
jgi:3-oxoacyl-[acyl-carrier-protein] synthase-3